MVRCMSMPNSLAAGTGEMTREERTAYLKASVEGAEGGFTPFNRGSLPTVSVVAIEVQEKDGKYTLGRVLKDGKEITAEDTFQVTCLNNAAHMGPFLKDESQAFEKQE